MSSRLALPEFAPKAELRDSKDEIVVGELIAGLLAHGWRCVRIVSAPQHHQLRFTLPSGDVLSAAHVAVDRRASSGLVEAAGGAQTLLGFAAEMTSSDSGLERARRSLRENSPAAATPPIPGEVRVEHQVGSVIARTYHVVNLDDYVQGTNVGTSALVDWAKEQVDQLRESLGSLT